MEDSTRPVILLCLSGWKNLRCELDLNHGAEAVKPFKTAYLSRFDFGANCNGSP